MMSRGGKGSKFEEEMMRIKTKLPGEVVGKGSKEGIKKSGKTGDIICGRPLKPSLFALFCLMSYRPRFADYSQSRGTGHKLLMRL